MYITIVRPVNRLVLCRLILSVAEVKSWKKIYSRLQKLALKITALLPNIAR